MLSSTKNMIFYYFFIVSIIQKTIFHISKLRFRHISRIKLQTYSLSHKMSIVKARQAIIIQKKVGIRLVVSLKKHTFAPDFAAIAQW